MLFSNESNQSITLKYNLLKHFFIYWQAQMAGLSGPVEIESSTLIVLLVNQRHKVQDIRYLNFIESLILHLIKVKFIIIIVFIITYIFLVNVMQYLNLV